MLKFRDILLIILMALIFGIVYKLIWFPVDAIKVIGFQIDNLVYGVWFMAGTFAMLIIRKPGAAILAETAAALIEVLLFGGSGIESFIYGFFQGAATEIIFAVFVYKKFTLAVTTIAVLATTSISLVVDYYYGRLALETWALTLVIIFRTLGAIIFAAVLVDILVKSLEKTGVMDLIRSQSKDWPKFDER